MNKEGDLQVWWIPQVPGEPFLVEVGSVEEGVKIMGILGKYDQFQFDHNIKPDYSNIGGLDVFEGGEWIPWSDPETGEDDPVVYLREHTTPPKAGE